MLGLWDIQMFVVVTSLFVIIDRRLERVLFWLRYRMQGQKSRLIHSQRSILTSASFSIRYSHRLTHNLIVIQDHRSISMADIPGFSSPTNNSLNPSQALLTGRAMIEAWVTNF